MDLQGKTPCKRVANFTTDEKALLAHLIKNKPIIESKLTDGKSITRKHAAWEMVTREFNCHVNKRETNTLKRAWDNMKAWTRKTRALERGNLFRTGGGPQQSPSSSQNGAIISMVEDAAPVMICEVKNLFDSDGTILTAIDSEQVDLVADNSSQLSLKVDSFDIVTEKKIDLALVVSQDTPEPHGPQIEDIHLNTDKTNKRHGTFFNVQDQGRKPIDYIRREAVLRIKLLKIKNKLESQTLKAQLEAEEIKKEQHY